MFGSSGSFGGFGQQQQQQPQQQQSGFGGAFGGGGAFGAKPAFGQSAAPSAFGQPAQQNAFGAKPFGQSTGFGAAAQTPAFGGGGSSIFGGAAGGAGGAAAPAFGSSTAGAFGAKPAASTGFGGSFGAGTTGGAFGMGQQQQQQSAFGASSPFGGGGVQGGGSGGTSSPAYQVTTLNDKGTRFKYHHICAMDAYQNKSPEELRFEDYAAGRKGGHGGTPGQAGGAFGSSLGAPGAKPVGAFGAFGSAGGTGTQFGTPNNNTSAFGAAGGAFGQQQQQQQPAGGAFGQSAFGQSPFGGGNQQQQQSAFGASTGGVFGQSSAAQAPFGGQQTGGLFGSQQQSTAGGFGSSAFGSQAGSAFGAKPQATPFGAASTGFGAQAGNKPAGGGLFGAASQPQAGGFGQSAGFGQTQGSSLFGGAQQQGNNLFGGASAGQNAGGGLFGGASAGGGVFGQQQQQQQQQQQGGGGLFGGGGAAPFGSTSATNTGGGLFGAQGSQAKPGGFGTAPGFGSFGAQGQQQNQQSGGLFGGTQSATSAFSKPATGGLFGAQPGAAGGGGGGLFGATAGNASGGGGLFNSGQNKTGTGLFGNTTGGSTAGGAGLFGNNTGSSGGGLFGSSATGSAGGFGIGGNNGNNNNNLAGNNNAGGFGGFGGSNQAGNSLSGGFGIQGQQGQFQQQLQMQQQQQQVDPRTQVANQVAHPYGPPPNVGDGPSGGSAKDDHVAVGLAREEAMRKAALVASPGYRQAPQFSASLHRAMSRSKHSLSLGGTPGAGGRSATLASPGVLNASIEHRGRASGYNAGPSSTSSLHRSMVGFSNDDPGQDLFAPRASVKQLTAEDTFITEELMGGYTSNADLIASVLGSGNVNVNGGEGETVGGGEKNGGTSDAGRNGGGDADRNGGGGSSKNDTNGSSNGGGPAAPQPVRDPAATAFSSYEEAYYSKIHPQDDDDLGGGGDGGPEGSDDALGGLDGHGADTDSDGQGERSVTPVQLRLTKPGYYTDPPIEELASLGPRALSAVRDLTVGLEGVGSVFFPGETDLRGVDIDSAVRFARKEIVVYEDEDNKPEVGMGLNRPAEVTLCGCVDVARIAGDPAKFDAAERKIRRATERMGARFISLCPETGDWTFAVEHFSRYGLDDDDDDDEEEEDGGGDEDGKGGDKKAKRGGGGGGGKKRTGTSQARPGRNDSTGEGGRLSSSVVNASTVSRNRFALDESSSDGSDGGGGGGGGRDGGAEEGAHMDDDLSTVADLHDGLELLMDDSALPPVPAVFASVAGIGARDATLARSIGLDPARMHRTRASLFGGDDEDFSGVGDLPRTHTPGAGRRRHADTVRGLRAQNPHLPPAPLAADPVHGTGRAVRFDPRLEERLDTTTAAGRGLTVERYDPAAKQHGGVSGGGGIGDGIGGDETSDDDENVVPLSKPVPTVDETPRAGKVRGGGGAGPGGGFTPTLTRDARSLPAARRCDGGLEGCAGDINLAMGRTFRPSWGPGDVLVRPAKPGHVAIVRGVHDTSEKDARYMESLLAVRREADLKGLPLDDVIKRYVAASPSGDVSVWRLVDALWGRDGSPSPSGCTSPPSVTEGAVFGLSRAEYTERSRRKARVSRWLAGAVRGAVTRELETQDAAWGAKQPTRHWTPAQVAARVTTHLTGHQIDEAVTAALEGGHPRLAAIVAHAAGSSEAREDIAAQLDEWEGSGVLATFPDELRRLYTLLSGDPGAVAPDVDWLRSFGLFLWYGTDHSCSVTEALTSYDEACAAGRAAAPAAPHARRFAGESLDIRHHLLHLYGRPSHPLTRLLAARTHAVSPLRASLSWHLLSVLETCAEASVGDAAGDRDAFLGIAASHASELERHGRWWWSAFVLSRSGLPAEAGLVVTRNSWSLEAQNDDGDGSGIDAETRALAASIVADAFPERVGRGLGVSGAGTDPEDEEGVVAVHHASAAMYASYTERPEAAVAHLVLAGDPSGAHAALVSGAAQRMVLSNRVEDLAAMLQGIAAQGGRGLGEWRSPAGGAMYASYLALAARAADWEAEGATEDDVTLCRSLARDLADAGAAIDKRTGSAPGAALESHVALADMATRVAWWAMQLSEATVAVDPALPIPGDYRLRILEDSVTGYIDHIAEEMAA